MIAGIYTTEMLFKCLKAANTEVFLDNCHDLPRVAKLSEIDGDYMDIYDQEGNPLYFDKLDDSIFDRFYVYAKFEHFSENWDYERLERRYGHMSCSSLEDVEAMFLEEHLAIQAGIDPRADSDSEEDWEAFWNDIAAMRPQRDPNCPIEYVVVEGNPFDVVDENEEDYDY